MKILYTGPFGVGSLTEARRQALIGLGHEVISLDQLPYLNLGISVLRKAQHHLLWGSGVNKYNADIIKLANEISPSIIYVDQALYFWPGTVRSLQSTKARIVHYTSEFFGFRRYLFRHLLSSVPLYDVHVITNSLNRLTLEKKGAKKIVMTGFGFDPILHRPLQLTLEEMAKYQADVVFIGHWEEMTEKRIAILRSNGICVKVWGPNWNKAKSLEDRNHIRPIYGEEYVKVIAASKICLCFLSKWNKNQSASRTFEIPAVGRFLLAERTPEHLAAFEEGKEAEFFLSPEELVSKTQYYLAHTEKREAIAYAGHLRCLSSGYDHKERIQQILNAIT